MAIQRINDELKLIIGTRKLNTKWSIEPVQDMRAIWCKDVERKLMEFLVNNQSSP
jgi:hypothetical protein